MPDGPAKPTFFLVPHTHWEGAVFQTRERYLDLGLPNILRALALLKAQPSYRFTLDQACYVKPFLERYPEEAESLRRFVDDGRLAIVGGTDVMLDGNMPGGESFARQFLYGKRFFRERLGVDVTTGWQLDTFGHNAQMPQLLRLAGFESLWFFRGVASWETPPEFLWQGIDGTRIPAYWLPHGYGMTYGAPEEFDEFRGFMIGRYHILDAFYGDGSRVGPGGADVCPPEEHLAALVEEFNRHVDAPCELRIATSAEYEAASPIGESARVVEGEFNPVFQGTYSSRIELKQWTRELETLLTTAEKLGVLLSGAGEDVDNGILERAWEPMLFNQAHDLMSGVMTDHVYEDTVGSYGFARRIAREETDERLRRYSALVDTRGEGIPLVVFNALGWPRTDVVRANVGFAETGVTGVSVVGPDGQPIASQVLSAERLASGGIVSAEIVFAADDVPALGHAVYRVVPVRNGDAPARDSRDVEGEAVLESDRFRVTLDATTGAVTGILAKDGGWEVLRGPGNIVVREDDHGDLWEVYRSLDGGSRIGMTEPHPVPPRGQAVYSDEQRAGHGQVVTGPVVSELTVEHAFGDAGVFRTRVRVHQRLHRIEIHTEIVNTEEFVRYRALFPTTIERGRAVHEIPFGAIERPCGIEYPAQNWVDWSDGERGLALLNRGIPGNAVAEGTLLLSLLRSTRIVAYGFGGGYEPGMTSDTGLELGKCLCFDYALVPHRGDWQDARVYREGLELNNPLIATTAGAGPGSLSACGGYLGVEPANIVVSALKASLEGTVALRLYEAAGRATPGARVRLPRGCECAELADLTEEPLESVAITGGEAALDFRGYEIKTLRLGFGG